MPAISPLLNNILNWLYERASPEDDKVIKAAVDKHPDGHLPIKGNFYHDVDGDGPDDTDPSGVFVGDVDLNQWGTISGTYDAGPHHGTFTARYVDPYTIDGYTDMGLHFSGTREGQTISGVIDGIGYWHGDYGLLL